MSNSYHNPPGLFPPYANYAHAVETPPNSRTLYVSGLNAFEADGVSMPGSFEGQAHVVWDHLGLVLDAAGMTYSDLVSLRFYLATTADDPANVEILRGPSRHARRSPHGHQLHSARTGVADRDRGRRRSRRLTRRARRRRDRSRTMIHHTNPAAIRGNSKSSRCDDEHSVDR